MIDIKHNESKNATLSIMEQLFEKRYQTADVHFVFEENGVKTRIPAHRNILAMGSQIFHEMFFGPNKLFVDGDIPTRSSRVLSQTFDVFIALFYGEKNGNLSMNK